MFLRCQEGSKITVNENIYQTFGNKQYLIFRKYFFVSLSTPMGVDYVVIGFDMEVQPLVTHNAA